MANLEVESFVETSKIQDSMTMQLQSQNRLLDAVSFAVAGMRDGIGPLLTVFLIQKTQLDPQQLSFLLAAPSFMNIVSQIPVGLLLDRTRRQGLVVAAGAILLALSAYGISSTPGFTVLLAVQLLSGLACCLVSVGVPAVSLTVSSAEGFGGRLARNEIFSKIGNFATLAVTGYVAQTFALHTMFYVVYAFAALLAFTSFKLGTMSDSGKSTSRLKSNFGLEQIKSIWLDVNFRALVLTAFVYQFANASLFLIFEQSFVRQQKNGGAGVVSAALFGTQLVIIITSLALARWTTGRDVFKLLRIGFALIFLRAVVFAAGFGLVSLAVSQILDGCVAAILIIMPARFLAIANPAKFNVMSGALGTCVAAGAMLSTLCAGYVIKNYGFVSAFLCFGIVAASALGSLGLQRIYLSRQKLSASDS